RCRSSAADIHVSWQPAASGQPLGRSVSSRLRQRSIRLKCFGSIRCFCGRAIVPRNDYSATRRYAVCPGASQCRRRRHRLPDDGCLAKANPQAFIEGNINLVKAGATLAIPDTAALRAISDREARRIFQQHTQAFAEYRQRIASRQGGAVAGGSTQSGPVVAGESEAPLQVAPPASGDQVVLSSGSGADPDAQADEQHATQRNIEESQARVSQL